MATSEPISFTVTLTAEDYTRAEQLYTRQYRPLRIGCWAVVIANGVLILVWTVSRILQNPVAMRRLTDPDRALWNIMSFLLLIALAVAFWSFMRRQTRRPAMPDETLELTFDDEGHRVQSATGESRILWNRYARALEDEQILLLVNDQQNRVFAIPRRAIPDDATAARLRALIEAHVGPINVKPTA